jgi:uncharacterized protein YbjT (DUF2867 family)
MGLAAIEAAGIEPALADPQQPATLLELVGDVTAVYWLLGSAVGEAEDVAAIHGPRLERFLERLVETPVRRFVYEAAGTVDPDALAQGAAAVEGASQRWRIPTEIVDGGAWSQCNASPVIGTRRCTEGRKAISLNSDKDSGNSKSETREERSDGAAAW